MSANSLASSIGDNLVSADVTLPMARSEQVQRWRSGERPPVEEFLGRFPGLAADTEAVMVLIYGEVTLREELNGTLPDPSEYTTRFPNLAEELRSQFALHGALVGRVAPPRLPGFDIQRELGRGGMGVVYLAHDRALRRPVAIKMLISGEFASETARGRFRNEARGRGSTQASEYR